MIHVLQRTARNTKYDLWTKTNVGLSGSGNILVLLCNKWLFYSYMNSLITSRYFEINIRKFRGNQIHSSLFSRNIESRYFLCT